MYGVVIVGDHRSQLNFVDVGFELANNICQSTVKAKPGDVIAWSSKTTSDFDVKCLNLFGNFPPTETKCLKELIPR